MTGFAQFECSGLAQRGEPFSLSSASAKSWDVIVIGAGPAGSLSARLSALNGLQTLLIEAKRFPRYKVCGGCLNPRALHVLELAGLADLPRKTQAVALKNIRLHAGDQSATFSLSGSISVSRLELDERLLEAARLAGVRVLNETTAQIDSDYDREYRTVTARHGEESARLKARVVICADGLSRSSARNLPELSSVTAQHSRVGIGTLLEREQQTEEMRVAYPPATIVMTVTIGGYIGVTCAEQNRLSVAAAFDSAAIKAAGSPEAAVADGLKCVGLPWLCDPKQVHWQGTPGLTSHANSVAAYRTFVVGDAAGYVEPFTGEGMAAALESAWSVAPLIAEAVRSWNDTLIARWQKMYRVKIRRRQLACRVLSSLLRYPRLVSASLPCFRQFPAAGRFVVSRIHASKLA